MGTETCRAYRPETERALRDVVGGGRCAGRNRAGARPQLRGSFGERRGRGDRHDALEPDAQLRRGDGGRWSASRARVLGEILDAFAPRGWFLPVVPGTKFVTVGGAIANDIHGKNHHRDGTFTQFVDAFALLTATGETLWCSREENADVFWATAGGIGLTGVILTARLRLRRIETAYIRADYHKAPDLDDALDTMAASDEGLPLLGGLGGLPGQGEAPGGGVRC